MPKTTPTTTQQHNEQLAQPAQPQRQEGALQRRGGRRHHGGAHAARQQVGVDLTPALRPHRQQRQGAAFLRGAEKGSGHATPAHSHHPGARIGISPPPLARAPRPLLSSSRTRTQRNTTQQNHWNSTLKRRRPEFARGAPLDVGELAAALQVHILQHGLEPGERGEGAGAGGRAQGTREDGEGAPIDLRARLFGTSPIYTTLAAPCINSHVLP